MSEHVPDARAITVPFERESLRRIIADRNLCGLANDAKWNELLDVMRGRSGWRPPYRFACLDGSRSRWDAEWFYHLPFPLLSVEWLDIAYLQEIHEHRLPPRVRSIDHSDWIEETLRGIGLDYRKGTRMIRVFGYSPRSLAFFHEEIPNDSGREPREMVP